MLLSQMGVQSRKRGMGKRMGMNPEGGMWKRGKREDENGSRKRNEKSGKME